MPEPILAKLRAAAKSLPAPMGARYQLLFHGKHAATGGEYVHIGGNRRETRGKYRAVDFVDPGDGRASPLTR